MEEIKQDLKKLFELSGLQMPETEAQQTAVAAFLKEVLSHFQKIAEIDTKGVAPLVSPLEQSLQLREDEIVNFPEKEAALNQAPETEGKFVKVPLVT